MAIGNAPLRCMSVTYYCTLTTADRQHLEALFRRGVRSRLYPPDLAGLTKLVFLKLLTTRYSSASFQTTIMSCLAFCHLSLTAIMNCARDIMTDNLFRKNTNLFDNNFIVRLLHRYYAISYLV